MADSPTVDVGDAVEWFLIIGALLAGVSGVVMGIGLAVPAVGRIVQPLVAGQELILAAMCAVGLMFGSLFLSEVQHYIPCLFCWYQRIAAYPLAVVLVIATIRKDPNPWPYALGLAMPGSLLSLYHIGLQEGLISEGTSCDPANPCSTKWAIDDKLGFVTIPMMALFGFVFIMAMAGTAMRRRSIASESDTQE